MARFNVITLINPNNEDFIERWDGEEYIVPAQGELQVPDFMAFHWVGDPSDPTDVKRALERRGDGGKSPLGIKVQLKQKAEDEDKQILVEDNKPIVTVKKTASKK